MQINLPTIKLRDYQVPAWEAFERWVFKRDFMSRIGMCWPRRSGKDTESLQMINFAAHTEPMNCWHLMPEATQARKAMWNGINSDGNRIIDVAFPPELRAATNESEMLIKLKCGSTVQFGGSDRYDALVGSNPRVVVYSEWAIANPRSYDYVRPILAENHGLAIFPYTPRGRNHGFEQFEKMQADPNSFAELLTCDDTGHMTAAALALEKLEMSSELYLQEYFGSWDFGLEGSYYAKYMNKALTDGRICDVPYDASLPVWVASDIGFKDATAMWFYQIETGGRVRFIDYLEDRGKEPADYVNQLREKGYTYGDNLMMPHDADHKRLGAVPVSDQFADLGFPCRILPLQSVQAGIEQVRVLLKTALFDEVKTQQGRSALNAYRAEYDQKQQRFKDKPLHDWASDGADAMRYTAQAIKLGYCANIQWGPPIDYSEMDTGLRM